MNSSTSGWLVLTRNFVAGSHPQNDKHVKRLTSQIEAMQAQLDRKDNKSYVAKLLKELNNRKIEVRQLNWFDYQSELEKDEWSKTSALCHKIQFYLSTYVGEAEAAIFNISEPDPLPEPSKYDPTTFRKRNLQWHINTLEQKELELRKITDRL